MSAHSNGAEPRATGGMWTFLLIWIGQFVSLFGSGLTSFGLGIWVYQRTGSATQYALISVFFLFPQVVVTMLGGAFADRGSRRRIMIVANAVAALVSALVLLALATGTLQIWLVYLAVFLFGICGALLLPSFSASVALLFPRKHLGRANGLVQLVASGSRLLSPLAAAYLLTVIGLPGLVTIDLASFLFAIATLAFIFIPQPVRAEIGKGPAAVLRDVLLGWRYIVARPGLLGLLLFFVVLNFAAGPVATLLGPLVLRFATPLELGAVSSSAGAAVMAGGLLMSTWGGPARRIHAVLPMGLLMGLGLVLLGLHASVPLIVVAAFVYSFGQPVVNAANATIWQVKVPPALQGRVLSTLRMSAWSAGPLAMLAAGPIADRVFEPLMQPGGGLADSAGRLIGTGPGRGIALLLIVLAVFPVTAAVVGYLWPAVRDVERQLPDAELHVTRKAG